MGVRYFAYGSNLRRARLEERIGTVELVGRARLEDYAHTFNKLGADGTAKGNIAAQGGAQVYGAVYVMSTDQFEKLWVYEGGYERIEIVTHHQERSISCSTFQGVVLTDSKRPLREYLRHYVIGGRELGIPDDYLRDILPPWYQETEPLGD